MTFFFDNIHDQNIHFNFLKLKKKSIKIIADGTYDGLNDVAYAGFSNAHGGVYWYENETDLLGLNDNELSSFKIYPNPTTNKTRWCLVYFNIVSIS